MSDSQSSGPGFESPLCYRFKDWAFSFSPRCPNSLSCLNKDLAIDGRGNMNEVFARNYCVARILPREAELVSEGTGLPGGNV